MRVSRLAALCLVIGTAANAQDKHLDKQAERLAKLSPDHFIKRVKVRDDDMTTAVVITSRGAYISKAAFMADTVGDVALDAIIDKKTKETVYRVVGSASYQGGWRFFETATYMTPDGAKDAQLINVNREVGGCVAIGCTYGETMAFVVDEQVLRSIAAKPEPWRIRFQAKNGSQLDESMSPAEISAVLARVESYKSEHQPAAQ